MSLTSREIRVLNNADVSDKCAANIKISVAELFYDVIILKLLFPESL